MAFLVEEAGTIEGPDKTHRFIIDPLDGTTNFLHGIPQFAISIALEREKQLISAVVFNPVTDEMFVAEKNHGAFLNDRRLRVSARKALKEALFATGIPFLGREGHELFQRELGEVMAVTAGVRRFGAASLDLAFGCGRANLRRLLGDAGSNALGHGGGHAAGTRGGRRRHRCRRRRDRCSTRARSSAATIPCTRS